MTAISNHPLLTETEYEAALAEAERLWDAPQGTPEGDQMEILITLIQAYEARHENW